MFLSAFAWSISEYCEASRQTVRIGLLHDAKDGLGCVHADAPALDDPLLPHLRQGGEGAFERYLELLLPGGWQ